MHYKLSQNNNNNIYNYDYFLYINNIFDKYDKSCLYDGYNIIIYVYTYLYTNFITRIYTNLYDEITRLEIIMLFCICDF